MGLPEDARGQRVAVRHDRILLPVPAVNLDVTAALQQLAAVGVGGAQSGELVADNVRVVRACRPVMRERMAQFVQSCVAASRGDRIVLWIH